MGKHKECWANVLDDCSSKLSREHIISASVYEEDKVKVWGLDWTGDRICEIPLSGAVSKILCKHHNESLSELDTSIKVFKDACKGFYVDAEGYLSKKASIGSREYAVNGTLFERWILKTALNGIVVSPKQHGNFRPDWFLVDLAFGRKPFNYSTGMGLYMVPPELYGQRLPDRGTISVRANILRHQGHVGLAGVLVTIFGLSFFLKTLIATNNIAINLNGVNLLDEKYYHPSEIGMLNEEGHYDSSVKLKFMFEAKDCDFYSSVKLPH